jgi:hypothetical protein
LQFWSLSFNIGGEESDSIGVTQAVSETEIE